MKKTLIFLVLITLTGCNYFRDVQDEKKRDQKLTQGTVNRDYTIVKVETKLTNEEQKILSSGEWYNFYLGNMNAYLIYPPKNISKQAKLSIENKKELYVLKGIDFATFKPLGIFAKDKNYAYYDNKSFSIDFDTFQVMTSGYAKDKNNVYYQNIPLIGADPKTAKVVDSYYLIDETHVFKDNKILQGANPKTYTILEFGYSKDDKNVYYYDKILPEADPQTFKILANSNYSKDKNAVFSVFFNDIKKIPEADPASFITLHEAYAKDKRYVYNGGEIMKNIDPAKFNP